MAQAVSPPRRLLGRSYFTPGRLPVVVSHHVLHDRGVPTHDHDFLEIVLVFGGTGLHRTLGGTAPLRRGDAFLLQPGAWHAYERCKSLRVSNCLLAPELLGRELAWLGDDPLLARLLWADPTRDGAHGVMSTRLPEPVLRRCRARLDTLAVGGDRPTMVANLLLLLSQLARCVTPTDARIPPHAAVARGVRLLQADPTRRWTLGQLAGELRLNPSYLVRLFKRQTGLSPLAYAGRLRLERAAGMLLRTGEPVSLIAARAGYDDANYFARCFRRRYGCSASAFRRRAAAEAHRVH